ncbi:MAG: VWA domain-containing protein [Verrucomicrobiales bacterium]|nr:VWA domain-containing protein [Verrucomicrobiales bacterium]
MNFLAPLALAFAATIPVVILFYLLKRKRVVRLVSSTLLWEKFLAETQASAPFQKLRRNWLLLLQIILLALVVLALARPFFAGEVKGGRLLVVILDGSASMQSRDVAPSRFDAARDGALELVDSLDRTDRMAVLLAAGNTEVKQSPTSNKPALRRALRGCEPAESRGQMLDALRLAQSLTRELSNAEIHLYSDGALTGLDEFENEGLNLVYHRIGEGAENRGIVAMDVRSHPEDPDQQAVFGTLINASTNTAQARVELRFDDQLVESRVVSFGPRESVSQVFSVRQATDGVFALRLTDDDALALDNEAWAPALRPEPARVLLVTLGNRFLERALLSAPRVQLATAPTFEAAAGDFDVTVLDGIAPLAWPAGNVLAIRVASTNWLEIQGELEAPPIVDWKNTHPLLRFVSFDNVAIGSAIAARPSPWAAPLVESPGNPLILAGEMGPDRFVWLAFDTTQSTWPLRVSFPIFMANAIEWLNPAARRAERFQLAAGDPLRVALPDGLREARIKAPDGTEAVLTVEEGSQEVVFGGADQRGTYTVTVGTNEFFYCANLLDAHESDIQPQAELVLGRYARTEATEQRLANLELWRWLAAAGLAVLLFEWWWYHKRTA